MIKNKLDLHMAALATAQKTLTAKNERDVTSIVLNDFDELKIDDRHFTLFSKIVSDNAYQFAQLAQQPLEPTEKSKQ